MSLNLTHLYLAVALLAAPAALGVASHTDQLGFSDEEASPVAASANSNEEAQTIETFEGEVPEDVTRGELDLRIDRGPVKVVGWAKDRYEIAVIADGNSSSGETTTDFQENVEEDKISLSLVVDHEQASAVEVSVAGQEHGDAGERAIVAHVPQRLTYETIHACEGQHTQLPGEDLVSEDDDDDECVEGSQTELVHGSIHITDGEDAGLNASWGLQGLEAADAQIDAHNGDVALNQLDVATLDVETHNGAIEGADVTAEQLTLDTHNGDIDVGTDAQDARVTTHNGEVQLKGDIPSLDASSHNGDIAVASPVLANGSLETHNGAIHLKATPATSGQLDLVTENGDVDVRLGHAQDVGYDVVGETENGDIDIALVDEAKSDDKADAESDDHYDHREREEARTSGYEDKPVQLALSAQTDNGAIEIVEQSADAGDGNATEDAGSSAGLAVLD